uniref:OCEL domain-containing protein n=1 Tax=Heterorhabditis bacteriophora TaxID=37862 RepID=A0A1I7XSK8_HETBA
MASPRLEGSPEPPALDVHRLESDGSDSESVVMVKLTDEIFTALMSAQRKGVPIRIRVDDQGGIWELGDTSQGGGSVFRYQEQALPGPPTDAVIHDRRTGTHRAVASFRSKYQVGNILKICFNSSCDIIINVLDANMLVMNDCASRITGDAIVICEPDCRMRNAQTPQYEAMLVYLWNQQSQVKQEFLTLFSVFSFCNLIIAPISVVESESRYKWRLVLDPLQIQATDKSFAETKERAQKLIEDEKSRGVKDVTKLVYKLFFITMKYCYDFQELGKKTHLGSFAGRAPTQHLNSELRKKKLRQRIIQLVVTGKLHNSDEVLKILRKDGLGEEQDSPRRVDEIVREVADSTGCGDSARLALKPSLNGEVDTRWPWFTQEEKAYVRRITQNLSQTKSSSFAPMRKSGMERMQAPSHAPQQTVSPEAIPTPPSSRPSSVVGHPTRKTPPKLPAQSRDSPVQIIDHRGPLDDTASTGSKRKAHVPSSLHTDKRPRQESSSPPEDPSSHPTSHNQKILAVRAGGSTASSRLSSPCSLSSPSQPSCDWEKNFVEIKSVQDAEKYFSLFQQDYPEYLECYKMLNDVAKEFRHLEAQLKNAGDNRKDCARQNIQNRFAHFDKDPEFLKTRQRHADLRAKLSVLKQRISDWERNQDSTLSMDMCAL